MTEDEAYWKRVARIKEEMLRVAYAENHALTATLAAINPQKSPWSEYWEQLLKENEELRSQVKAQTEKQPVAWIEGNEPILTWFKTEADAIPLYTTPPQRKPLTDEEERKAFEDYAVRTICNPVELQRERLGGYSLQELNYLWRGWKARAAHGIKE